MVSFLIDVYDESVRAVEIEDDLDTFYKLLDCRCIDIPRRRIGDKYYNIVCDDEGLFHDPQKISAIDSAGNPMLVGNLLFFKGEYDGKGNLVGLDEDDVDNLISNLALAFTENCPAGYTIISNCEY